MENPIIKEVVQYCTTHAGKGINPRNKCQVLIEDKGKCYEVRRHNTAVYLFPESLVYSDSDLENFEVAHLLLQLGRPQAAPIQWTQTGNEYRSDCGFYKVGPSTYMDGSWMGYFDLDYILGSEEPKIESTFAACQAHRQKRFEHVEGFRP
jgi:hypothetical protein